MNPWVLNTHMLLLLCANLVHTRCEHCEYNLVNKFTSPVHMGLWVINECEQCENPPPTSMPKFTPHYQLDL